MVHLHKITHRIRASIEKLVQPNQLIEFWNNVFEEMYTNTTDTALFNFALWFIVISVY